MVLFPEDPDVPPIDYRELHTIVRELTYGIYVLHQTPLISLEANYDQSTSCQLPPAYQDTRIGQILVNVDYIMKCLCMGPTSPKTNAQSSLSAGDPTWISTRVESQKPRNRCWLSSQARVSILINHNHIMQPTRTLEYGKPWLSVIWLELTGLVFFFFFFFCRFVNWIVEYAALTSSVLCWVRVLLSFRSFLRSYLLVIRKTCVYWGWYWCSDRQLEWWFWLLYSNSMQFISDRNQCLTCMKNLGNLCNDCCVSNHNCMWIFFLLDWLFLMDYVGKMS